MEEEERPPEYARNRRIRREVDRVLQRRRHLDALRRGDSDSGRSENRNVEDVSLGGDNFEHRSTDSSQSSDGIEPEEEEEVPYEGDNETNSETDIEFDNQQDGDNEEDNIEEMDDAEYLRDILHKWAADGGAASMSKLDQLLRNLAVRFPNIPLSYKTLLRTPRRIEVTHLNHGSILWYKSIRETLSAMDMLPYLQRYGKVELDIGIDGLPLSRSSSMKFWPILGHLVGSENQPFVICLYLGEKDPDDVYAYLMDYVIEVDGLLRDGFSFLGVVYPFSIRNYILDAPARAFVKCCVLFSAHCSCEKCVTVGRWFGDRMTYVELDAVLRTDESYRNQDQPQHHEGRSPLEEIGTGMVSQFRLDPLHLIYLGVFKRLVAQVWLKWNGNFKLHWTAVDAISDVLMSLKPTCPSDFNRAIRSFAKIKRFKGTEFRRMCHYDSILIFRDNVNVNVYKHFLLLYVALYVLAHPVFVLSQAMLTLY